MTRGTRRLIHSSPTQSDKYQLSVIFLLLNNIDLLMQITEVRVGIRSIYFTLNASVKLKQEGNCLLATNLWSLRQGCSEGFWETVGNLEEVITPW